MQVFVLKLLLHGVVMRLGCEILIAHLRNSCRADRSGESAVLVVENLTSSACLQLAGTVLSTNGTIRIARRTWHRLELLSA